MLTLLRLLISVITCAAVEQEMSIEEFLQKMSSVDGLMTLKDPFIQSTPPFGIGNEKVKENITAPVMQRYSVLDYVPIAVLIGDQYPRALVKIPNDTGTGSGGSVVIVKLNDKIGNKSGVITKIEKTGLTVVENVKSPLGFVDKAVIVLPVGGAKPMANNQDAEKRN